MSVEKIYSMPPHFKGHAVKVEKGTKIELAFVVLFLESISFIIDYDIASRNSPECCGCFVVLFFSRETEVLIPVYMQSWLTKVLYFYIHGECFIKESRCDH